MSSISVVMSVYNGELHIKEAMESILSQTFADFEFVIINDASTDTTESIIKSFNDPRIKLIKNDKNLGLAKSLNIGLDLAKGKYISRMDADDISLPERFQKQFDFMEENPGIDVCGSWYEFIGARTGVVKYPLKDDEVKANMFFYDCICHPSVFIRKESLDKHRLRYNEEFRYAQDYELWCRGIKDLKFANMPCVLLKYRVEDTGKLKEQSNFTDVILKRNLDDSGISLNDKEKELFCICIARESRVGDSSEILETLEVVKKLHEFFKEAPFFNEILLFRWWRNLFFNRFQGFIVLKALIFLFPFKKITARNCLRVFSVVFFSIFYEFRNRFVI